ncbi:MAG TPA: hypothetical protein DEF00_00410 [Candidatus Taylorbacteria bacterium]|nr:MAG: hypothetical protein UY03_C0015G0058 [Parcubacteria group bacterium GW2011_GWA2_47_64]KKU95444.1 MAG: hypothetical protein UY29_C0027G0006 [Parcubacteria group bacterium GW2011_GWC2_48_17]HBV00843.1 hypothetical protein [Candidatus Taylorbacteria bacterium]
MNRYEKLAAVMREAVKNPDKYPEVERTVKKENGGKHSATFSSRQREMKPVSGADAMARWQQESEDDERKGRADKLREKQDGN